MMTPKERWLAAIHMEPVDRLPFWPKLNAAYARAQAAPFRDMTIDGIHDWIGSDKHTWIGACVKEVRTSTSVEEVTRDSSRRTVYRTPSGATELVEQFDEASQAWHPVKHPVQSRSDVRIMTEFFAGTRVELEKELLRNERKEVASAGQDALVGCGIGESPLMHWIEWLAGTEAAHYLLADCREDVEALFEAMHEVLLRKTEILVENSPAHVFYMGENTSTTLISPEQHEQYCCAHIEEYGRIARDAGRPLILHMCGHLKALLPRLAQLPADAFEAFTSPPVGNTRLLDGRTACPEKCLIGGTNAVLWTKPAHEIIAEIEKDLDALPHHRGIAVTSAGVMPPLCKPETIKEVCEWARSYPARM